ncbi:alkaline phosphatase family protein [Gemmatimonadota bacterium]
MKGTADKGSIGKIRFRDAVKVVLWLSTSVTLYVSGYIFFKGGFTLAVFPSRIIAILFLAYTLALGMYFLVGCILVNQVLSKIFRTIKSKQYIVAAISIILCILAINFVLLYTGQKEGAKLKAEELLQLNSLMQWVIYILAMFLSFAVVYLAEKFINLGNALTFKSMAVLWLSVCVVFIVGKSAEDSSNNSADISEQTAFENQLKLKPDAARVVYLVMDGATWDFIDPLIEMGLMKNLAKIKKKSAYGRLKTLYPTKSPPIWYSMVTGKKRFKHGIWSFRHAEGLFVKPTDMTAVPRFFGVDRINFILQRCGWGREIITKNSYRKCKTIWNILDQLHEPVAVINHIHSYPVEKIRRGIMLSDYSFSKIRDDSSEEELRPHVFPDTLIIDLVDRYDEIKGDLDSLIVALADEFKVTPIDSLSNPYVAMLTEELAFYSRYLSHYFNAENWRFFSLNSHLIDQVQHDIREFSLEFEEVLKSKDMQKLIRFASRKEISGKGLMPGFMLWDHFLGQVVELLDDNTYLFIISDHGHSMEVMTVKGVPVYQYAHTFEPEGIFMLSGPGIEPGEKDKLSYLDPTPTMLYLLGLPVAEDMDGKTRRDLFTEKFVEANELTFIPTFKPEEIYLLDLAVEFDKMRMDEETLKRMKSLGYVN